MTIGRDDGGRGGQQSAGEEGEGQPLGMMVTGHCSLVSGVVMLLCNAMLTFHHFNLLIFKRTC